MHIKQEDKEIDVFVGTKIGSFKHVIYNADVTKNSKKSIVNLIDIKSLQKDEGITCMEWGNKEQTEILIGKKNQEIQVYSTDGGFLGSWLAECGPGALVGLGRCGERLVAAAAGGAVRVWAAPGVPLAQGPASLLRVGSALDRMRLCTEDDVFATGGEENDLRIYRVGEEEPVFSAKNMAHDWLQLRRPLWVSDLAFCPGEGGKLVAVCSRYGYVRLYDSRAQRRPVCNIELDKMAATCIAPAPCPRQVVVGFGRGQLHLADFRALRLDKGFKGCAGAVTAAAAAHGLLVSASLDRHLRVHCFNTKDLLYKQYLTSKLSSVLVRGSSGAARRGGCAAEGGAAEGGAVEGGAGAGAGAGAGRVAAEGELDALFDQMETVGDKAKKNKQPPVVTKVKKMKPSLEGSTVDLDDSGAGGVGEHDREDAIKKLLRSTEKQKRRMEKEKKKKKAKSVFHNA